MTITVSPRISGGFVNHVLKDESVSSKIKALNLSERDAHDLAKQILIVGTRDINIDFKKSAAQYVEKLLSDTS